MLEQINYAFDCYAISAISMEEVHNQSSFRAVIGVSCPANQAQGESHTCFFAAQHCSSARICLCKELGDSE